MSAIDVTRSDIEAARAVSDGTEEEAWGMTTMTDGRGNESAAMMFAARRMHDNHGPDIIAVRADILGRLFATLDAVPPAGTHGSRDARSSERSEDANPNEADAQTVRPQRE